MREALTDCVITEDAIQLIADTDRSVTSAFMRINEYVDVLIPRGGAGLIRAVVENSTIPVIETGTGNCHVYVDRDADVDMAIRIIFNAKTQRTSVCNACESLPDCIPVLEEDYGKEYLDYILLIKTVDSLEEAIAHINRYSTHHSECIVTRDDRAAESFLNEVDAACVYVNASTWFTDGFEFGFGAEIGVSTQKLYARGPMGLKELTSYKYTVRRNGQIRE